MPFIWHPDQNPPTLEEHSRAKLDVLRRYLRAYFDTLSVNPARDEFKLDLVDGFAGGGTFLDNGVTVSGSPLIMLEECEAAMARLNEARTKPLRCDFKTHLVEKEFDHFVHLQRTLTERGFRVDDDRLAIHHSKFADVADQIIADIRRRQPRAGRAIFLLDQTGFSQVEFEIVRRIFGKLPAAEVIMTFAADALMNFLSEHPHLALAVAPIELTESRIQRMIEFKACEWRRALMQRSLREHVRRLTNAEYDTPFFIRPKQSRRALWFLHLSRHPKARDVMIQCHWSSYNIFEHYGSGGFDMLGWDALISDTPPLFHFAELDAEHMRGQLLSAMPHELHAATAHGPISVDSMHQIFANRTAARFSDLDRIVMELAHAREFDIISANGKVRSHSLTRLQPGDQIAIPVRTFLPGLSPRHLQ